MYFFWLILKLHRNKYTEAGRRPVFLHQANYCYVANNDKNANWTMNSACRHDEFAFMYYYFDKLLISIASWVYLQPEELRIEICHDIK